MFEHRNENGDGGEESWLNSLKKRPKTKPFFMWFASYDAHRDWGPNKFSWTAFINPLGVIKIKCLNLQSRFYHFRRQIPAVIGFVYYSKALRVVNGSLKRHRCLGKNLGYR